MKKLFFFIILFFPALIFSQINDDFEDGNIDGWTEGTTGDWIASATSPITGTYSLKHNLDDVAGTSFITHNINGISIDNGETIWQFNFKNGAWNPSGSNYFGVYLFSDIQDLSGQVNGYVFGVNMTGTSDVLTLWKASSGSFTSLVETPYVWPNSATIGVRITRSATGTWTVEYDEDGGFDNLVSGGSATDNTFNNAFYFGAFFEFTSTRAGEFWLDDVSLTGPADTDPPAIQNITAVSSSTLIVDFNEDLNQATAETISNYNVDGGIGNSVSATLNAGNHKQVLLSFSGTFTDNTNYTLTVNNVEDLSGNSTVNETASFSYIQIAAISASPASANTLDVLFNKTVDATTAQNTANYSVDGSMGNPTSATVDGTDDKLVHLSFASDFVLEQDYTLTVSNVEDTYGNVITTTDLPFNYYVTQPFDVVINEIMCDVNPAPEAIPAHEYIEIYNNSAYDINLDGWTLTIGTNTPKIFPSKIITAGGYAIICEDLAESDLAPYGTTVGILNPSELTITGKRIQIKTDDGTLIEDITYSKDWYHDIDKDDGGWSMERIDPTNFCSGETNWTATVDYTGGTPGRQNSVYALNPDNTAPEVSQIEYVSSKHLEIHFSEKVKTSDAENSSNYILNTSINPISVVSDANDASLVDIFFSDNFTEGQNTLDISNIQDNCDNLMTAFSGTFIYMKIYPKTVEVMSANQLRIHFSEKVDQTTAENVANYTVNGGIGNPTVAIVSSTDDKIVNLQFASNFTLEQSYTLIVQNVQDVNANIMNTANLEFIYYIPHPFDIVFNEVMADINPAPVSLPAERYIELYNTSDYDIDLTNWIFLSEGQSERIFPYIALKSHEYLILCEEGKASLFSSYGNVVDFLTSSDIIASGRNLKLMMPDYSVIGEITYEDTWYNDPDKDNGGWSLERIDPTNFCGGADNWAASVDQSGGTPGKINSVYASNQDNTAPELTDVKIISSNYIILQFNENISSASGSELTNFSVDNGIGNPAQAYVDDYDKTKVHLKFSTEFFDNQNYELIIENVSDNCGNIIQITGYDFTYRRIHPIALWVKDEKRLELEFSETPEFASATDVTNYSCNNGIGNPEFAVRETIDTTVVHLQFANNFPDGTEVFLMVSGIKDINGNTMKDTTLKFSYYTPKENDIAINEVLFNAYPDGSDFVELYNRTQYPIDLVNLQLAKRDADNPDSLIQFSPLSKENKYFEAGTYLAFTPSKEGVLRFYMSQNEENIYEISDFPTYPDDMGTVVLLYKDTAVIDEFSYDEKMHFPLLDDNEGVSLERVNYDKPTQDVSNWHSASELVGFATPAYQNSQYNDGSDTGTDPVNIDPHVFSPDNDGFDDYANINFKFDTPDNVASIYIFDAKGRIIKTLAESLLLSTEGTVVWNGTEDNGRLAPAGTYIVYCKIFDADGNVKVYKKSVILAKKI